MRRVLIAVVLIVGVAWWWARRPLDDMPADSRAVQLFGSHLRPVDDWDVEIEDTTRPTNKHGSYAGEPTRKIKLRVWQSDAPVSALIVYSHGFGGNRDDIDDLNEHLASLGYVVVAPSFPSTNTFAPRGPMLSDVVNQPQDQRFIIDRVLEWNATVGHKLYGRIDPQRIGAYGVSLGGLTTTLLAFDPARRDPRIKAVAALAGLHSMFTRDYYQPPIAYLEIAGDKDAVVPYASHGQLVASDIPGSITVVIAGGSHSGFVDFFNNVRFLRHPDVVACSFVRRQVEASERGSWRDLLGPTAGVRDSDTHTCEEVALDGRALDPRSQQRIASVAVSAFFQSQLAADAAQRKSANDYLRTQLVGELAGTRVDFGP